VKAIAPSGTVPPPALLPNEDYSNLKGQFFQNCEKGNEQVREYSRCHGCCVATNLTPGFSFLSFGDKNLSSNLLRQNNNRATDRTLLTTQAILTKLTSTFLFFVFIITAFIKIMKTKKRKVIEVDGSRYNGVELLSVIDFLLWLDYDVRVKYGGGFNEYYSNDGFYSDGLRKEVDYV
jgi:hypothetical protein